uniref:K+-dependent Na+/Ca+ exchanger n=1 Tax=uncultured bacterium Contigcl_1748 TaxID=1393656 RepID=W0FSJ9_9BACT|nr:K+-dependent Na+/Ca+ exchanger [uncultured bacterium Contigcl_1748]
MLLDILLIIVGVVLVIWGADRMTDGAVSIAQRLKIPKIVIGLTIVAMGTSAPEFFVSLMSALKGTPDLAVGNVVGSNIFNTLLIVGVAAMVTPIVISRSTVRKDMPWSMLAAVLLTVMCLDSVISRWDALVLFVLFCTFIGYNLREARKGKAQPDEEEEGKAMRPILAVGLVLLGLGCLVLGSNVFVDSATRVAQQLGVSEAVIGLTIVAGGTSLPELATSVVAARKGQSAIAIGNVIGSNVFNVLMIIGITGLVKPMNINGITNVDLGVMTGSMVLVWLFSYTKFKVERWEGAVLTGIFTAYMCWLISLVI